MKTRTNFTHRVDMWNDAGQNIVEHLAGVEDFEVAETTYRAAVRRTPPSLHGGRGPSARFILEGCSGEQHPAAASHPHIALGLRDDRNGSRGPGGGSGISRQVRTWRRYRTADTPDRH